MAGKAEGVKNLSRGAKQLGEAAKSPAKALSFFKNLFDGSKSKISNGSAGAMTAFALVLDAGQALVGLLDAGYLSAPISLGIQFIVYTIWFRMRGVSYWGSRKATSKVISVVVEEVGGLLPYVNVLWPAATVMVVSAIGMTRFEEASAPANQDYPANKGDNIVRESRKPAMPDNVRTMRRSTLVSPVVNEDNPLPRQEKAA